jgi:hypothetical protein
VERVEPVLPKLAVLAQPLVDFDERVQAECVDPALRVLAYVDQAGFTQHAEMPGHARASDRESLGQLSCTRWVVAENIENRASALVCQRVEYSIHTVSVTI